MLGAGVGFGVFSLLAIISSATLGDPRRSPWMKSSVSAGALQQCPDSYTSKACKDVFPKVIIEASLENRSVEEQMCKGLLRLSLSAASSSS